MKKYSTKVTSSDNFTNVEFFQEDVDGMFAGEVTSAGVQIRYNDNETLIFHKNIPQPVKANSFTHAFEFVKSMLGVAYLDIDESNTQA